MSEIMPTDIQIAVRRFVDEVSTAATAEDHAERLRFDELHPTTQIAILDGLDPVIRAIATAARAS